jgi:hypothetical protein
MEIQLIDVGRGKINKTVVVETKNEMWRHIDSCLLSSDIELMETDVDGEYIITVGGYRNVGKIIIKN